MTTDPGVDGAHRAGDGVNRRRGAPRPRDRARDEGPAYAALDLGSNNCRLLIARPAADGDSDFTVIDAFSRIVRLGEGMGAGGNDLVLSEEAVARTVKALKVCAGKMRRRGVHRARCVATEACRRAANADIFLARVRRHTGITLEVISDREEAELAVSGCAPLFDGAARHALIFDIGGGSTELTWVALGAGGQRILATRSVPCGVIALSERFGGDRYHETTYDAMIDHFADLIAPFEQAHGIAAVVREGGVQMIGTSGTVTTLAGIKLGLKRYDRARVDGMTLDFDSMRAVSGRLAALDYGERADHPCVGRDRADLVVGGCAALEAICRAWPTGHLVVADRGVREGILYALMAGTPPSAPVGANRA